MELPHNRIEGAREEALPGGSIPLRGAARLVEETL